MMVTFALLLFALAFGGIGFALGFLVGRRSRPAEQRGFEVVSVHHEKQQ